MVIHNITVLSFGVFLSLISENGEFFGRGLGDRKIKGRKIGGAGK